MNLLNCMNITVMVRDAGITANQVDDVFISMGAMAIVDRLDEDEHMRIIKSIAGVLLTNGGARTQLREGVLQVVFPKVSSQHRWVVVDIPSLTCRASAKFIMSWWEWTAGKDDEFLPVVIHKAVSEELN